MNPITWVQGLDGTTLVVAICVLMFIEEVGVPLPFAPGDLVLAIGGIAIAGGRVNPFLLVGAVSISITVGALIGREAARLLGWDRLMNALGDIRDGGDKKDLYVGLVPVGVASNGISFTVTSRPPAVIF